MKKLRNLLLVILAVTLFAFGFSCKKESESQSEEEKKSIFTYSGNTITGFSADALNLNTVTIPSEIDGVKITRIGAGAFKESSLQEVTISEGITVIGEKAFADCTYLSKVNFPSTLEVIDDEAFAFCLLIKEIVLPNALTLIDENAFDGCEAFEKITFNGSYEKWQSIDIHHDWETNGNLKLLVCNDAQYGMNGYSPEETEKPE